MQIAGIAAWKPGIYGTGIANYLVISNPRQAAVPPQGQGLGNPGRAEQTAGMPGQAWVALALPLGSTADGGPGALLINLVSN